MVVKLIKTSETRTNNVCSQSSHDHLELQDLELESPTFHFAWSDQDESNRCLKFHVIDDASQRYVHSHTFCLTHPYNQIQGEEAIYYACCSTVSNTHSLEYHLTKIDSRLEHRYIASIEGTGQIGTEQYALLMVEDNDITWFSSFARSDFSSVVLFSLWLYRQRVASAGSDQTAESFGTEHKRL